MIISINRKFIIIIIIIIIIINYFQVYIRNGVNLKGYFYWSTFDTFELASGYAARFGLYFTDYKDNYKRIPKQSAKWFCGFLKGDNTTQLTLKQLYPSPPSQLPAIGSASTLNGLFAASAAATISCFFALF